MYGIVVYTLMLFAVAAYANDARALPEPQLTVKDQRLSANFDNQPLEVIFRELSRRTDIKIFSSAADVSDPVSAHFQDKPLDEGIRSLLEGKSYTLQYHNTAAGPRIAEIRLSGGSGPVAQVQQALAKNAMLAQSEFGPGPHTLAYEATHAKDPVSRLSALQKLEKTSDDKKLSEAVAATLRDGDARVRALSLKMVQRGASVGAGDLKEMAQKETDVKLRAQAWDELLERSENTATSKSYLDQARQDADPGIKAWAERKLQELQAVESEEST